MSNALEYVTDNARALWEHRKRLITRRGLYKSVFDTPNGKRVLKDLAKFCDIGHDIMAPGDPYKTHYNVGKQRVFLRIQSILHMDMETIERITKET